MRKVDMMHSSKGGKWRKSTGARRKKYDRAVVNMRDYHGGMAEELGIKECNSVFPDE